MSDYISHTIAVTDRRLVQGDFLTQIRRVCALKPYALILREKDLTDEAYERLASEVMRICSAENVVFFVNSRIDTALKLGCRGIHLPVHVLRSMSDAERAQLKQYFDDISVSCHSAEEVDTAVRCGASQIVLGTIFETECKKGLKGKGIGFVRDICAKCPVPVYAIGGMTPCRIEDAIAVGAAGGCMMSGFMKM